MPSPRSHVDQIEHNIRAHDRVARTYERRHGEIYNVIEQARLQEALKRALALVQTDSTPKLAVDFGCGAGNLTSHLSSLGCDVLACDVSEGFLDLIASRRYQTAVTPVRLNGGDLSNIDDDSADLVAAYSVLHHVPDYLGMVAEMVRVLKPGGVLFIDHELCAEMWTPSPERAAFLSEVAKVSGTWWRKYLALENYTNWFIWKFVNPRYRSEGDIHVFADDHIEWDKVADTLTDAGAEIVDDRDYLLFRRGYRAETYERFRNRLHDMKALTARKRMRTTRGALN
jgi:ubiquinone/menaquinone biosynthesis C-methylase UbiE